ncbi:putative DNA polymerase III epsilon subunit [Xanthomonas phage DMF5-T1]|nr:putative DNA polymerase III epsilon subunit [Xanthomonas phage DMF5-T1]
MASKKTPVTADAVSFIKYAPAVGPKILHIDIETSQMIVWAWGLHKQFVGHDDIIQDWNVLSFCAKWQGVPLVIYDDLREQKNPTKDKRLCVALSKLLTAADVVVAHNGKKFDLKKIRSRMAHNKLKPVPDTRIVDTLLESRKVFGHTSHKLAYLTTHFGEDGLRKLDHGKFAGKALWRECQTGNLAAWEEMRKYNIVDVLAMESMYKELRGWYQGAQNLAIFSPSHDGHTCPNCGSTDVRQKGYRHTQVSVYARYRCNSCGGWSRGREQVLTRKQRAHVALN